MSRGLSLSVIRILSRVSSELEFFSSRNFSLIFHRSSKLQSAAFHSTNLQATKRLKPVVSSTFASARNPSDETAIPQYNRWTKVFQNFCGEIDRAPTPEEWEAIYKATQEDPKTKTGFFGAMMTLAGSHRYQKFADSLMDFLKQKSLPVTPAIVSKYLRLLASNANSTNQNQIVELYNTFVKTHPMAYFDVTTAENLIIALHKTDLWRDCLSLLKNIEVTTRAGPLVLSHVVAACFLHGEPDLAKKYLEKLYELAPTGGQPFPVMFIAWFQHQRTLGMEGITELLNAVNKAGWFIPVEVAREMKQFFETLSEQSWKGNFTTITDKGECHACGTYLPPIVLKREEFDMLQKAFMSLISDRNELFIHTNPAEFRTFRSFMERSGSFDIVLDGLNAAYFQSTSNHSPRALARQLRMVVEHLVHRRSKRILVIGRKHMDAWPREEMNRIRDLASMFLVENASEDDHFLLYGALHSGPDCVIMSKDLYRDYRFKVEGSGEQLRQIFLRWQRSHQMELMKVYPDGSVKIKAPMRFDTVAQWNDNSFHIPYDSGLPRSLHELPSTWLCLSRT